MTLRADSKSTDPATPDGPNDRWSEEAHAQQVAGGDGWKGVAADLAVAKTYQLQEQEERLAEQQRAAILQVGGRVKLSI